MQTDIDEARDGSRSDTRSPNAPLRPRQGIARLLALGGIFGAALASSCCVVPLLLVTLGVSGAWIGNLTALAPYKSYFLAATGLFLAAGFWHVYVRPRNACVSASYCETPGAGRVTRVALWAGTVLAGLAATIGYWAPLLY